VSNDSEDTFWREVCACHTFGHVRIRGNSAHAAGAEVIGSLYFSTVLEVRSVKVVQLLCIRRLLR
jgi:hypothetical protein